MKRGPAPARFWPRVLWWIRAQVTWPWQAHKLKKAGFRRTGWQKWEWP